MTGSFSAKPVLNRKSSADQSTLSANKSECSAIIFIAVAIFLILCLFSYNPKDPSFNVATVNPSVSNLCGLVGSHISDALAQLLGLCALLIPFALIGLAARNFVPNRAPLRWPDYAYMLLFVSVLAGLCERFFSVPWQIFPVQHSGGAIGGFVHYVFRKFLGSAGEIILGIALISVSILKISKISVKKRLDGRDVLSGVKGLASLPAEIIDSIRARFPRKEKAGRYSYPADLGKPAEPEPMSANAGLEEDPEVFPSRTLPWEKISIPQVNSAPPVVPDDPEEEDFPRPEEGVIRAESEIEITDDEPWIESDAPPASDSVCEEDMECAIQEYLDSLKRRNPAPAPAESPRVENQERVEHREPQKHIIVTKRADEEEPEESAHYFEERAGDDYILPPAELLDTPPHTTRNIDVQQLEENAATLVQKLADLGVKGEVVAIHPGPVITMYELMLAPGIPLRRILGMSDDLAMALKSGSTRVVAPIPGKDTVGIEVPNLQREIVYFREIVESKAFKESDAPLKVALGKGIDGEPFATSLVRMPHLLIAGATGTGKSVGLNCLICSWLVSCHPDEVKFLMVDPKKLELSYYQDIPHLIHPVVTEPEKVPKVLNWALKEMERRYDLLSEAGAKNIESYNQKVPKMAASDPNVQKLPYIVIIVDELAELMMVAAKDIEISIARLAQMARAAGIHLILATQRPSVDVITGIIKANFPARLSFQVSAKPDSRTILDTTGAEHLLGMGDMLFLPPGTAKLRRLHGAYVSENEIRRVVDHIKAQRAPVYLKEISMLVSEEDSKFSTSDLIDDVKYDEAVELVTRLGHASISLIQRHMRIGYNRAARIIEAMESEGIIGPSDGTSRPREVLARSLQSVSDQ